MYDLDYRNFDPVLGRMHGVDPMASKYSSVTPYNYAFNNPVLMNDPSGADPNPGEPDHVTRRGINLYGIANSSGGIGFYGSGLDYGDGSGMGSSNLWDSMWGAGGWNNVGGIANGNQAMSDYYSMSESDYIAKYATTTTNPSAIRAMVNNYNNLIVARYSVVTSQNGISYGYNIGVNAAGKAVLADKTAVTQGSDGIWMDSGPTSLFDFGGYYGMAYSSGPGDGDRFDLVLWAWKNVFMPPVTLVSYVTAPIGNKIAEAVTGVHRAAPFAPVRVDANGEFVSQKLYGGEFGMPKKEGLELFQNSVEFTIGAAAGGFELQWGSSIGTYWASEVFGNVITAPVPYITDPVMNQVKQANGLGSH